MVKSYVWRATSLTFEVAIAFFVLSLFIGNHESSTAFSAGLPPLSTSLLQVAGTADLAVSKTDSPDPVVAGSNLTYTISFTNSGPDAATTVQVQDSIPAGSTFVSALVVSGAGWSVTAPAVGGTGAVTFSKATVAIGETAVFNIVVRVSTASPSLSNTVTAGAATNDPVPGNSASTAATSVALFDLCIQDDRTRAVLSINTSAGTFQFTDCSKGIVLTGVGTAIRDPSMCKIFFNSQTSKSGSTAVSATLNLCTMVGTAQVFRPGSSMPVQLNDSNIQNNTCGCQ